MSDEIKDCPFCGAQGMLICGDGDRYYIACNDDYNCAVSLPYQVSQEEAVRKWNKRTFIYNKVIESLEEERDRHFNDVWTKDKDNDYYAGYSKGLSIARNLIEEIADEK